jgi:hypothetical protein
MARYLRKLDILGGYPARARLGLSSAMLQRLALQGRLTHNNTGSRIARKPLCLFNRPEMGPHRADLQNPYATVCIYHERNGHSRFQART